MSASFDSALITAAVLIAIYLTVSFASHKPATMQVAVELIISSFGVVAGVKICFLIASGELARALDLKRVPLTEEDFVYFFIGGLALVWVALDDIRKKCLSDLFAFVGARVKGSKTVAAPVAPVAEIPANSSKATDKAPQ